MADLVRSACTRAPRPSILSRIATTCEGVTSLRWQVADRLWASSARASRTVSWCYQRGRNRARTALRRVSERQGIAARFNGGNGVRTCLNLTAKVIGLLSSLVHRHCVASAILSLRCMRLPRAANVVSQNIRPRSGREHDELEASFAADLVFRRACRPLPCRLDGLDFSGRTKLAVLPSLTLPSLVPAGDPRVERQF